MSLPHQLWRGRVLYSVATITGFPGIPLCRFMCLPLQFFMTSWTHAMHMPPCLFLAMFLCVLKSLSSSNPPFHNSKKSLLKTGYINGTMASIPPTGHMYTAYAYNIISFQLRTNISVTFSSFRRTISSDTSIDCMLLCMVSIAKIAYLCCHQHFV